MVDARTVSLVATGALLLVALALGVRVLAAIVREGRERSRKRREGELERYTDDPVYDRELSDSATAGTSSTCPQCGAENDSEFTFCRECAAPLGPANN